jgi:transcriptional repressor NrdR
MQGIAEVTEQASAGSEEMASSSEELGAQAAALRDLVARFKTDNSRVSFDGRKLRAGMSRALEKRPVSTDQIEAAINRITRKLASGGESEVPSRKIGELVMDELRGLDQVAYVRFASVYRKFEDVNAFREEIEMLQTQPTPEARRQQLDFIEQGEGEETDGTQ